MNWSVKLIKGPPNLFHTYTHTHGVVSCCPFKGGGSYAVDSLLIVAPDVSGGSCNWPLFCDAVHNGISLNAIILLRKSKLIALSSPKCREVNGVLRLFRMLQWVGLQCVLDILTFFLDETYFTMMWANY